MLSSTQVSCFGVEGGWLEYPPYTLQTWIVQDYHWTTAKSQAVEII